MSDTQRQLRSKIADHLATIETYFTVPVEITIVVRMPSLQDGGVLVTSEKVLDVAMAEIQRLSKKETVTP